MNLHDFNERKGELETLLGLKIFKIEHYIEAFTHKSYANECPELQGKFNERLEFLGDSILGFYASMKLMQDYPLATEGELTAKKAQMVRASSCAIYIRKLGLDAFFLVGKGEVTSSQRAQETMHADLFEAFLAALYLDQGVESTFTYLDKAVFPLMEEILNDESSQNWKALLQDLCQKQMKVTPTYKLLSESGPEHDKVFEMGVFLDDKLLAQGKGKTKKDAEKLASKNALMKMEEENGH